MRLLTLEMARRGDGQVRRLLTLDQDETSRDALALAVLEGAAEGTGPRAAACKAAFEGYQEAITAGKSAVKARDIAKAVLASFGR